MTKLRTLWLLVALAVAVSVSVSAGAFGSADVQRAVAVTVVDDERAYLGVRTNSPLGLPHNETEDQRLVELTNRFPTALDDVSVSVVEGKADAPVVTDVTAPSRLSPGDAGWITADVDCGVGGNEETIAVSIDASSLDGSSIELSRELTIDCLAPPSG